MKRCLPPSRRRGAPLSGEHRRPPRKSRASQPISARRRTSACSLRKMEGRTSTSSGGAPYHGDYYPRKYGSTPDVVPSGVTERKAFPPEPPPDAVSVDVLHTGDSGGLLC